MNGAWPRGVRDILTWVLAKTPTSPLCKRTVAWPSTYDLTYEEAAADDAVLQGRPAATPSTPRPTRHRNTARVSKPPSPGYAARQPHRLQTTMATALILDHRSLNSS
jgi:hypothetical protein